MVAINPNFVDGSTTIETLGHPIDIAYSECVIGNPTDKETLIVCHGFTSSRKPLIETVLKRVAENAINANKDMRILTFDWPGHGESGRVNKYSFALLRGCLFRFMKELNIERAHIFGMSMGGIAGIIFAAVYPDKVLSLTIQGAPVSSKDIKLFTKIAGTASITPALMLRRYVPNSLEFVPENFIQRVASAGSILSSKSKFKDLRALAKDNRVRKEGIKDLRKFSLRAFYDFVWEFLTLDIRHELTLVKKHGIPVLMIDGDAPEHVFIDTLPRLKELLGGDNSHIVYISGVGHMASILKPREVARSWMDFFNEVNAK